MTARFSLTFLPKPTPLLAALGLLMCVTACDRFAKPWGADDYPAKPYDGHAISTPDEYAQPADVTATCTAGPKSRSGNPSSYKVLGRWYRVMPSACGYSEEGLASWYGPGFHGKRTSSGERYDMHAMTAAHKSLPIPVRVRVTNLDNGKSLIVRVNDRGPFHKGRIIDLSKTAARRLGVLAKGTARVRVTVVDQPPGGTVEPTPGVAHIEPTVTTSAVETFAVPESAAPVVVSDHLSAPQPTASGAPVGGVIYIQVGSFANQANAEALKAKLERDGITSVRLFPVMVNGVALNRVRVGGLATTDEAERLSVHLKGLGYAAQQIVVED